MAQGTDAYWLGNIIGAISLVLIFGSIPLSGVSALLTASGKFNSHTDDRNTGLFLGTWLGTGGFLFFLSLLISAATPQVSGQKANVAKIDGSTPETTPDKSLVHSVLRPTARIKAADEDVKESD